MNGSDIPRRSKNGCQQCRHRKRKCDERHPCCTACIERNLPCNWRGVEAPRKQLPRRQTRYNKDFAVPHEMRPLTTVFTAATTPVVQALLSHFRDASPLWLTIGGAKRRAACQRLIMPVAARSRLVLNCVLALAAGDLSKYHLASSDMANLSCGFYGQALEGIRSVLDSERAPSGSVETRAHNAVGSTHSRSLQANIADSRSGDEVLLAVILLCVHEVKYCKSKIRIYAVT